MRSLVAIVVAVVVVGNGYAVYADPATPLLSPLHGQREDAQRLWEQLRTLDREAPPEPVIVPPQPQNAAVATQARASTVAPQQSLSDHWWFWAIAGGVAVTAIGVTYETTRSSGPQSSGPRIPGVTCDASGCHP